MRYKRLLAFLGVLVFSSTVSAQVPFDWHPRHVAQFQPGQERECELHWVHDLMILRVWQQEVAYWRGRYNAYAEFLGFGAEYDKGDPVLNRYEVSENIIDEDYRNGIYSSFIESCNAHVQAGHDTEYQFAVLNWIQRNFVCHARNTVAIKAGKISYIPCTADWLIVFPREFEPR